MPEYGNTREVRFCVHRSDDSPLSNSLILFANADAIKPEPTRGIYWTMVWIDGSMIDTFA